MSQVRISDTFSEFREIREKGYLYVDKTAYLVDILNRPA